VKNAAPLRTGQISSRLIDRLVVAAAVAALVGCAGVKPSSTGSGGGTGNSSGSGNGGSSGGTGFGGSTPPPPPCANNMCTDFPPDPIFDNGVPASVAGMFSGSPPGGSGPCIMEPEDGTLFPNNWLRPRVHFSGANGKVVQITMSAANQANTLTAYTMSDTWILPKDIWNDLSGHQIDNAVTVTVWVQGGGSSSVKFTTAPVGASGNLVFWAADPMMVGAQPPDCYKTPSLCSNASELRGFSIGDESTVSVLAINQVMQMSRAQDSGNLAPVICIGCHTGTADDSYVSLIDHYSWRAAIASVSNTAPAVTGGGWPALTGAGLDALQQPGWGPFTWTKVDAYWSAGMRIGVASLGEVDPTKPDWGNSADQNDSPHLAWINIEAPMRHVKQNSDPANWAFASYAPNTGISSGNGIGFLAHTGDAGGAATPSWSHDGMTIAYASTNASISGRLNIEAANVSDMDTNPLIRGTKQNPNPARKPGLTDIYTVPFAGGLGGAAKPVSGAATPDFEEYYPAYSPDDAFIAYTRVPAGQVMYANPNAEIAVVPAAGGAAMSLVANKPPACTGATSPGVNNHWPKWSPDFESTSQGTFYWLIFSSNRAGLPPVMGVDKVLHQISQLYMAPLVRTETGFTSYPAIYLWNQPTTKVNTTPAWSTFVIPPVP
jgi:hypothetical protein